MNETAENGDLSLFGVLYFGAISWLTPENIDLTLKVVTGIGAFVSAILAARYYWYAAKEKKQALKKNADGK